MNLNISDSGLPSKTWEIIAYARLLIGGAGLQKVFKVGHAQVHRYAKDPEIFEDACQNPIDGTRLLLMQISECGGEEGRQVSKIALNLMARDCGFKVVDIDPAEPTTDEPRAEFLEFHNRIHELQASAQNHEDPLVVEAYADKVADTLSAFLVRYMADYKERGGDVRFSKTAKKPSLWQRFWAWV